jgi:hypothetical protein
MGKPCKAGGTVGASFSGAIMDPIQERQLNEAAYRQLRSFIQQTYPPGRFLAISAGKIVADAASFADVNAMLHDMGNHSAEVLVVQAGIEYPETVVIFSQDSRP